MTLPNLTQKALTTLSKLTDELLILNHNFFTVIANAKTELMKNKAIINSNLNKLKLATLDDSDFEALVTRLELITNNYHNLNNMLRDKTENEDEAKSTTLIHPGINFQHLGAKFIQLLYQNLVGSKGNNKFPFHVMLATIIELDHKYGEYFSSIFWQGAETCGAASAPLIWLVQYLTKLPLLLKEIQSIFAGSSYTVDEYTAWRAAFSTDNGSPDGLKYQIAKTLKHVQGLIALWNAPLSLTCPLYTCKKFEFNKYTDQVPAIFRVIQNNGKKVEYFIQHYKSSTSKLLKQVKIQNRGIITELNNRYATESESIDILFRAGDPIYDMVQKNKGALPEPKRNIEITLNEISNVNQSSIAPFNHGGDQPNINIENETFSKVEQKLPEIFTDPNTPLSISPLSKNVVKEISLSKNNEETENNKDSETITVTIEMMNIASESSDDGNGTQNFNSSNSDDISLVGQTGNNQNSLDDSSEKEEIAPSPNSMMNETPLDITALSFDGSGENSINLNPNNTNSDESSNKLKPNDSKSHQSEIDFSLSEVSFEEVGLIEQQPPTKCPTLFLPLPKLKKTSGFLASNTSCMLVGGGLVTLGCFLPYLSFLVLAAIALALVLSLYMKTVYWAAKKGTDARITRSNPLAAQSKDILTAKASGDIWIKKGKKSEEVKRTSDITALDLSTDKTILEVIHRDNSQKEWGEVGKKAAPALVGATLIGSLIFLHVAPPLVLGVLAILAVVAVASLLVRGSFFCAEKYRPSREKDVGLIIPAPHSM